MHAIGLKWHDDIEHLSWSDSGQGGHVVAGMIHLILQDPAMSKASCEEVTPAL